MNGFNKKLWKNFDFLTLAIVFCLFLIGVAFIVNATASAFTGEETGISQIMEKLDFHYARLQILWFVVGLALVVLVCAIDYHVFAELIKIPYVILNILLVILLIVGNTNKGIAAWFEISGRMIQPSEFMKIVLIIGLARYAADAVEKKGKVGFDQSFLKMGVFVGIPFVLVVLQPDFGTAITYVLIVVVMLFAAKFPWYGFVGLGFVGIIGFVGYFFAGMEDYQRARLINSFNLGSNETFMRIARIEPDQMQELLSQYDTMQVDGALKAIRSGGLWGKGFFKPGTNVHLGILPEAHTDFIFASGLEVVGVVGGIVIILLYILLIARAFYVAYHAKDTLGTLMIVGVVAMEMYHIFENIGMNIGLLPVTGIPLPFVSYGGSNMLTNMLAIALIVNVAMRRPNKRHAY